MRYRVPARVPSLVPLLVLVGIVGCERERSGPTSAEHEALLQRLDAMEQRLDVLEDARAPAEDSTEPGVDPRLALPRDQRPKDDSETDPAAPSLHIHVHATGVRIDGEDVTRAEAAERFEEIAAEQPGTRLVVLAEPDVPHRAMVEILDLARTAGLEDIAMSARVHGSDDAER